MDINYQTIVDIYRSGHYSDVYFMQNIILSFTHEQIYELCGYLKKDGWIFNSLIKDRIPKHLNLHKIKDYLNHNDWPELFMYFSVDLDFQKIDDIFNK